MDREQGRLGARIFLRLNAQTSQHARQRETRNRVAGLAVFPAQLWWPEDAGPVGDGAHQRRDEVARRRRAFRVSLVLTAGTASRFGTAAANHTPDYPSLRDPPASRCECSVGIERKQSERRKKRTERIRAVLKHRRQWDDGDVARPGNCLLSGHLATYGSLRWSS